MKNYQKHFESTYAFLETFEKNFKEERPNLIEGGDTIQLLYSCYSFLIKECAQIYIDCQEERGVSNLSEQVFIDFREAVYNYQINKIHILSSIGRYRTLIMYNPEEYEPLLDFIVSNYPQKMDIAYMKEIWIILEDILNRAGTSCNLHNVLSKLLDPALSLEWTDNYYYYSATQKAMLCSDNNEEFYSLMRQHINHPIALIRYDVNTYIKELEQD